MSLKETQKGEGWRVEGGGWRVAGGVVDQLDAVAGVHEVHCTRLVVG